MKILKTYEVLMLKFEFLLNSIANQMHLLLHLDHKLRLQRSSPSDPHDKPLFPSNPYQKERKETRITAHNKTIPNIRKVQNSENKQPTILTHAKSVRIVS